MKRCSLLIIVIILFLCCKEGFALDDKIHLPVMPSPEMIYSKFKDISSVEEYLKRHKDKESYFYAGMYYFFEVTDSYLKKTGSVL